MKTFANLPFWKDEERIYLIVYSPESKSASVIFQTLVYTVNTAHTANGIIYWLI